MESMAEAYRRRDEYSYARDDPAVDMGVYLGMVLSQENLERLYSMTRDKRVAEAIGIHEHRAVEAWESFREQYE